MKYLIRFLIKEGLKNVEHFLNPTEEDLLPLDSLFRIDEAYQRVDFAITNNECIGILFDTDLDGITSGTEMTRYLRHFTTNN